MEEEREQKAHNRTQEKHVTKKQLSLRTILRGKISGKISRFSAENLGFEARLFG